MERVKAQPSDYIRGLSQEDLELEIARHYITFYDDILDDNQAELFDKLSNELSEDTIQYEQTHPEIGIQRDRVQAQIESTKNELPREELECELIGLHIHIYEPIMDEEQANQFEKLQQEQNEDVILYEKKRKRR